MKGFFDRTPTIRTHGDMMTRLAERTGRPLSATEHVDEHREDLTVPPAVPSPSEAVASTLLTWADPVRHGDGSGYQLSACGIYSVVKERLNDEFIYRLFLRKQGTVLFSNRSVHKAREFAQTHAEGK
jgi:hypothetical protein